MSKDISMAVTPLEAKIKYVRPTDDGEVEVVVTVNRNTLEVSVQDNERGHFLTASLAEALKDANSKEVAGLDADTLARALLVDAATSWAENRQGSRTSDVDAFGQNLSDDHPIPTIDPDGNPYDHAAVLAAQAEHAKAIAQAEKK